MAMTESPPPSELPESGHRENQLRFLVTVGRRHWKLVFFLTLAISLSYGVFGYVIALRMGPSGFESSLELSIKQFSLKDMTSKADAVESPLSWNPSEVLRRIDMGVVAERVWTALEEQEGARPAPSLDEAQSTREMVQGPAKVGQALSVQELADSMGIVLTAYGETEKESSLLADLTAEALIVENDVHVEETTKKTAVFLREELAALRRNLDEAEGAEWEFLREKGFHTYDEVSGRLRAKNAELIESQAQRREKLAALTDIEEELRATWETLPLALSQITDSLIVNLLDDLQALRKKELVMGMMWTGGYPPLTALREEIAEHERTVLEAVRRYEESTSPGTNVWDARRAIRDRHTKLQLNVGELDAQIASLDEQVESLFDRLPTFATDSHEYRQIERDIEGFRKQYNKTLDMDFDLRSAVRRGVGRLERATPVITVPRTQPSGRYVANFIIGALAGFLIAFSLAIMIDMMDTSIKSEEDAAEHLGKAVVGTIPKMRFTGGKRRRHKPKAGRDGAPAEEEAAECIVTLHDPKSPISEAYRILRTNFQFATVQQQPKTLMVTSAVPGEGKTTTAINLAIAMAASGSRVLLMDCDLRRPNVHRMLRLPRNPGLMEVLVGQVDIHDVMLPTQVENLLVVPSGHLPANPSELIGSARMHDLVAQLGQEFDILICDAPSVIVVTDPLLLATHVDSSLMLVSVNNASRETIQRALNILETAGSHIAGIVLNGLDPTRRRYYYYYYYSEATQERQKRRWYQA